MNLMINLPFSTIKIASISVEITLNIQINYGNIVILTILSLPIHKHGISIHLDVSLILSMIF